MRALLACVTCLGCGRVAFDGVGADATAVTTPLPLPTTVSPDGGFAYVVIGTIGDFGTLPDWPADQYRSTLRFFEDGVELGPAHSVHVDIRNLGMGRFSHWTLGTDMVDTIRFSASDNSDPRTNGRVYAYLPY